MGGYLDPGNSWPVSRSVGRLLSYHPSWPVIADYQEFLAQLLGKDVTGLKQTVDWGVAKAKVGCCSVGAKMRGAGF